MNSAANKPTLKTLQVLAGAYRGRGLRDLERGENPVLLTHLLIEENGTERVGCRQPIENLADEYSDPDGVDKRPTCKTCGKKWDRLTKG